MPGTSPVKENGDEGDVMVTVPALELGAAVPIGALTYVTVADTQVNVQLWATDVATNVHGA